MRSTVVASLDVAVDMVAMTAGEHMERRIPDALRYVLLGCGSRSWGRRLQGMGGFAVVLPKTGSQCIGEVGSKAGLERDLHQDMVSQSFPCFVSRKAGEDMEQTDKKTEEEVRNNRLTE